MVDEGKQEEKFDFTAEAEVLGYISLDQARVLAMRTARESPGAYGRRFTDVPMAFEVVEAEETEDHYVITLTFRPEGEFTGTTGREQFFIEKEGAVALRQVLSLPGRAGWRRIPLSLVAIGLVIIVAAAVGGVFATTGGGGNDDPAPLVAATPTGTPEPPILTPSPAPTIVPVMVSAVVPTATPSAPTPIVTVPVLAPTPTPLPVATPTPGPTPTPTLPRPRLLHWWPGDGNANDVVGGSEGVMLNGATFGPGRIGQAFSFPKTRSHLRVMSGTDDFNLEPNEPMTIAMWLKRTEPIPPGQGMQWIGKHRCGDGSSHYVMYIDPNGNLGFLSKGGGNVVAGPNHLPIDQWKHFVATSDGTFWMLYVDGIPEGGPVSGDFQSPNNAPLIIGGNAGCTEWFGGLIDDVAFFNYTLSAREIQAIYDGGDLAYLLSMHLGETDEIYEISLVAGESMQLVADVQDSDGNRVGSSLVAWQLAPDVGTFDDGIFTAGTKVGAFSSGIQVDVVHEGERASAVVDVIVEPGQFASIEIEPSEVVVQQGETVTLTAKPYDEYGNPLPAVMLFLWEAESGLTVDQTGEITAGEQGGRYEVSATASYEGSQQTASATVSVPPVWVSLGGLLPGGTWGHSAVPLPNGNVLVVGRHNQTVELYESSTGRFSATLTRCKQHGGSRATLLSDLGVLITGGQHDSRCAQIYDPETGGFSRVGEMNYDHWTHAATLLSDGRVLISGGFQNQGDAWLSHAAAEIFDPESESFTPTGSLNIDRLGHTATLLTSGRVLVTSGEKFTTPVTSSTPGASECIGFPELYDPNSGTFIPIEGLGFRSCSARATLLNTGEVLVTSDSGSADIFYPATGTFRATGAMTTGRGRHTATLLPTGQVLVTGGWTSGAGQWPPALATAELYDLASGTFTATVSMNQERQGHTATLLPNGYVLVTAGAIHLPEGTAGGSRSGEISLDSAELWIPSIP